MQRRNFLTLATAAAVGSQLSLGQSTGRKLIKPPTLKPGDTVGIVTPSTYVSDPDEIATALRTVAYFGLKAKVGKNVRRQHGFVGGSIAERAADINAMFADPEVKAVFAVRGGYGSAQILPALDYELIRKNPKIFQGYSDITAMHLAIHQKTGLVTFHGPVLLSGFSNYTQEHYRKALFDPKPLGELGNPPETNALRPRHTTRTIVGGTAKGQLTGGNLTLIATTMGTPYEVDARGKILFIEDVGEEPYSMDRMLTQLRLSGKLDQAAGIVFGECNRCTPKQFNASFENNLTLGQVVDEILGGLKIPVLAGLTIGHTEDQLTLPLGVMATLDADRGKLTITESATA